MAPTPDKPPARRRQRRLLPGFGPVRIPVSILLMLAMLAMAVLGVRIVQSRDDPLAFAFYVTLALIFFLVVLFRALWEVVDIIRRGFREQQALWRETIGEQEFVQSLGERVSERLRDR